MRRQRKPSIAYTYYATPSLLVLLPHSPSPSTFPFFLTSELVIPPSITSISVFSFPQIKLSLPCRFFFAFSPPPFTPSSHPFLPLGMWKHLLPAACCVCVSDCVYEYKSMQLSMCIHACVQSYILDDKLVSECFTGQQYIRWSPWSLWWEELTYQQEARCWETQNAKQDCTQISFHCRILHFNPLLCFWTLMAWKLWECKIILAQRAGGVLDFCTHTPFTVICTFIT